MRSQAMAVLWGIWARSRTAVLLAAACVSATVLMKLLLPEASLLAGQHHNPLAEMVIFHIAAASLLLTLSVFSYTEFDPQKSQSGFPRRLFVLPVTSFQMVFVPMALGVMAIELLVLMWSLFNPELLTSWFLVALPAYMVFYQATQWILPRLGSLRLLLMGIIGIVLIMAPMLSALRSLKGASGPSINTLTWIVAGLAVMTFFITWIHVARQRFGGGATIDLPTSLITRFLDAQTRPEEPFRSPGAAQFWFEWRRSGLVLPLLVSGLLITVIGPISWHVRNDSGGSFQILTIVLTMPVLLAWPIGKGFSKPDFWSQDLSMSGFIAVKPITNADVVLIKMKVAAASAMLSWLIVIAFLIVWAPLSRSAEFLKNAASLITQVYGASGLAPIAIAILVILAGTLLTWRFMVSGLWLGLSGNKNLFMAFAVPYAFFPLVMIATLIVLSESDRSFPALMNYAVSRPAIIEVIAAMAVIAKCWAWVFSWRDVTSQRVSQYLLFWGASTLLLVVLAICLWEVAKPHLPAESEGVRNLLLLVALFIVPLARVGYAPSTLAKNRHRA
jgi:hypothetical protein